MSGDLLLKLRSENVSVSATDDYRDRVSLLDNFSLLLSSVKLSDQHTFTCMQTDRTDIKEFYIDVVVHSESTLGFQKNGDGPRRLAKLLINLLFFCTAEAPTELSITNKAEDLEIGKPTKVWLFFFFFFYFSKWQTVSISPPAATNQGKSLHLSRGISKARWRHRYYSNEFSQVILMNT